MAVLSSKGGSAAISLKFLRATAIPKLTAVTHFFEFLCWFQWFQKVANLPPPPLLPEVWSNISFITIPEIIITMIIIVHLNTLYIDIVHLTAVYIFTVYLSTIYLFSRLWRNS